MASFATRRVHRTVGILLAAPIILFTLTGISLQFSQQLELDQKYVQLAAVVDLYGVQAPGQSHQTDIATQVGSDIFLNRSQTLLFRSEQQLVCAFELDFGYLVVLKHSLVLVPAILQQGQYLSQDTTQLPWQATACANPSANSLIVKSQSGTFNSTDLGLSWQLSPSQASNQLHSAVPIPTPHTLAQAYLQHKITYERLIQDLHSGRLAGTTGIWIANLATVGLFLLALTGIWLWLIRPKR